MASYFLASSAGMMPSQSCWTSVHSTFISSQSALAMSMSKPTSLAIRRHRAERRIGALHPDPNLGPLLGLGREASDGHQARHRQEDEPPCRVRSCCLSTYSLVAVLMTLHQDGVKRPHPAPAW